MQKSIKLIFCGKKWGPNQWFCSREKSSKSLKKNLFEKKIFQHVCAYITFKTVCRNFLKINASRDIYVSVILKYRKMVLHNKISNETWPIKNQENSVQHFVENYLTNHLAKFLQDRIKPWRVGALRVFFLIGIHSMQGWTATTRHGVTRKEAQKKDYKIQKICLERTYS